MSWVPETNKIDEAGASAAFWYWQYDMHAYWRLEETDGYEFLDPAEDVPRGERRESWTSMVSRIIWRSLKARR